MLTYDRHIAHLDLDAFFVSVEQLRNPKYIGKPILIGGSKERGVVAACSYEARKFGIHSAMPMAVALRLCKNAIVVKSDFEAYSKYSSVVTEIIKESVRQLEIPFGYEKSFLAPLSIMKIPGVGKQTGYQLLKMGVETVKTLSEIPVELLQNLLGKNGTELWRKANGIDDSPVLPYREEKSISTEQTFQKDSIDLNFLNAELVRMVESLAFELRSQNRLTGCVTVKLRYSDFETHTIQKTISHTNGDHIIIQVAKELFAKLFQRRMLIRSE